MVEEVHHVAGLEAGVHGAAAVADARGIGGARARKAAMAASSAAAAPGSWRVGQQPEREAVRAAARPAAGPAAAAPAPCPRCGCRRRWRCAAPAAPAARCAQRRQHGGRRVARAQQQDQAARHSRPTERRPGRGAERSRAGPASPTRSSRRAPSPPRRAPAAGQAGRGSARRRARGGRESAGRSPAADGGGWWRRCGNQGRRWRELVRRVHRTLRWTPPHPSFSGRSSGPTTTTAKRR